MAGQYIFTIHAQERAQERHIPVQDVLNILLEKTGYSHEWVKGKDEYKQAFIDEPSTWYYRIEGTTPDQENIRVIISFEDGMMPIITVIKL